MFKKFVCGIIIASILIVPPKVTAEHSCYWYWVIQGSENETCNKPGCWCCCTFSDGFEECTYYPNEDIDSCLSNND